MVNNTDEDEYLRKDIKEKNRLKRLRLYLQAKKKKGTILERKGYVEVEGFEGNYLYSAIVDKSARQWNKTMSRPTVSFFF